MRRRHLLGGTAIIMLGKMVARAATVRDGLPWQPNAGSPPPIDEAAGWRFFTAAEAKLMEAIADRIIPPDAETPGGGGAGCAVFLDRQLAGAYGASGGLYKSGPYLSGSKSQGPQSADTPRQLYRAALASLEAYCQSHEHQAFENVGAGRQDELLRSIEQGELPLAGVADGKEFFTMLLKDMQEGFFSDPLYGGNRDMCAWKMIGYPGAHYDYRDWVSRHNELYPHPPVSIMGRAAWTPKKA